MSLSFLPLETFLPILTVYQGDLCSLYPATAVSPDIPALPQEWLGFFA
jgi:hypothetical protein